MSIVLQSSGGGQITLLEPATASNFTQTLPAATGTVMVSGNMPAFSAYGNAQSFSNATWTKIPFQTKEFDTANAFDATTNYRFQPLVGGYYQINSAIYFGFTTGSVILAIYKNGSEYKRGSSNAGVTGGVMPISSSTVYFNGSTDYVEIYLYQNTGSAQSSNGGGALQWFNGCLVRAA